MKKLKFLFFITMLSCVGCTQYKSLQKTDVESNLLPIKIDLTKMKTTRRDTSFLYENISIKYVKTTDEDCTTGKCHFDHDDRGIWLYPARIVFDLSKLSGINKITISGVDYCGKDCTKAFTYGQNDLFIQSVSNSSSGEFLFSCDSDTKNIKSFAISSCEGVINNIIIE